MVRSLVVDHTDPSRISYAGRWVVLPAAHFTSQRNATATFTFDGSSASLTGTIGLVGADIPPLSYTLDGEDNRVFTFDSERPHILYSSPPLHNGHHTLSLTLLTNMSFLSIESMLITVNDVETGPFPRISWTRHRIIEAICGAIIGVVAVIVILLALFIFFRRRKRDTIYNSMGPLQVALPTTKEAFTARNCSTYGLSFLPYDPGSDNFTQLPPRRSRHRPMRPVPPSKNKIATADCPV